MSTVLYKANTIIESPLNLKYWTLYPYASGASVCIDYPTTARTSTSIPIKVISYNDTVTRSGGTYIGDFTLDETYQVGNDTIYEYTLNTGNTTTIACVINVGNSCTKLMIEASEDVRMQSFTNLYCSANTVLLHAPRVLISPTPSASSSYNNIVATIYNDYIKYNEKGNPKHNISEFAELMQYYNCLNFGNLNIEGDISVIASNIHCDQLLVGNKSNSGYSGMRIMLNNTRLTGSVVEFYNILKQRRATKWICQLYVTGSAVSKDVPNTAYTYGSCDGDGVITYYDDWSSLLSSVPSNE